MLNAEKMLAYFSQIRRVYAEELKRRLKMGNFSPNEISILILLANNSTVTTSSQLGFLLGVSKGLVSRSVDTLIGKGYLETKKDSDDGRIRHLLLTEAADQAVRSMKKEIEEINETILKGISVEEIDQMEATMQKIIACFKEKERVDICETENVKRS